jgi:hypothetical protein
MAVLTERQVVTVVGWTARAVGVALLGLFVAFAIGEGGPNPLHVSLRENLLGIGILTMIIGQLAAWKWEGIGGLLILGSLVFFTIVNERVVFNVVTVPWLATGLLYLLCWWRTPTVVSG